MYLFGRSMDEFCSDFVCVCVRGRRDLGDFVCSPELDICVQQIRPDAGINQYSTGCSFNRRTIRRQCRGLGSLLNCLSA